MTWSTADRRETRGDPAPAHRELADGYDERTVRRLLATNWIRTAAWTLRMLLVVTWLAQGLRGVARAKESSMGLMSLFKKDPRARIEREIRTKSRRAVEFQRNGKLVEFAALTAEVEALERELQSLEQADRA